VFPLIIAISNQDEAMLDYLWSMNELWDYEHLKIVLEVIFTRNLWVKGIKILLGAEATEDEYNALSYNEKKQFILELYYRYLHYSPEETKEYIRKLSVHAPYALISLHYLMSEEDATNNKLIIEACKEISIQQYAKMKYYSGTDFMKYWNGILNQFLEKTGEYEKAAAAVDKAVSNLEKKMKKHDKFKSFEVYKDWLDQLDQAVQDGDLEKTQELIIDLDIRNLRRTKTPSTVMIPGVITVDTYWNALHIAIYYGHLDIV
jgi:hypothetical protein